MSFSSIFAQSDYYTSVPPTTGSSSLNARAPHGRFRYQRGVILIGANEMTNAGLSTGDVINSIAFNYLEAQNITTSGTLTLYLENTTDAVNNKPTTWSITGMQTVRAGSVTIPNTSVNIIFNFTGGSTFTYAGGGVYVAFDYQNAANPLPTTFVRVNCNTDFVGAFKGAQSDTTVPTTVSVSDFRPVISLGKSVTCARPADIQEIIACKTTTSLTGSWIFNNNTSIEYGISGFIPGIGAGTVVNNITSPYTINGLSPSTIYDVYFRNNCGTQSSPVFSAVPDVESFHTVFLPASPTYSTGFEQDNFPFISWLTASEPNGWFANYGGPGSVFVQGGEYSAAAFTPAATAANARLFSRGINLSGGSTATITYYVRNFVNTNAPVSTNTASYQLTVGNNQTAASQTTILASETGLNNSTFVQKTYTFTPITTGVYYFSFLHNSPANATGTHAFLIDTFAVSQSLSTDEFDKSSFSVFPNPAKDIINISNSENIKIYSINISDVNGRIVNQNNYNIDSNVNINISTLSSGIYFINIKSSAGSTVKKIIKN